ncbi:Vgb family protein [Sphingomonas bacterium]|uniref:Vgb family protein n=1 Tax=Sphingomonas bacterium TaxID=1895847 RepID=UPI00157565B8|nr:hypothetical protein [Sphingomonas bacterium]
MADLRIEATIAIGKTADWVAVTAAGLWVGSTGPNAVSEIDPATNRVTRVELPGRPCAGLAADPTSLWVPLCGPAPQLAKVDLATRKLSQVFALGPAGPEGGIAIGAGSVWLVTDKTGSLSRIDPGSGTVVQTVKLPPGSYNPVFANGLVWVTRVDGAELTVVDPASGTVVGQVAVGPHPRFTTTGGGAVWTLNQQDGSLSRIDATSRAAAKAVALNTPGPGGDITYADGRVWTTMMKTPLTAIDARSGAVLCQWQGEGGDSLGIGHGAIWLTNLRAGTVSRIALKDIPADCAVAP